MRGPDPTGNPKRTVEVLQILDMRTDKVAQAKAKRYGIKRVPALLVNGKLADCCQIGGVDPKTLRNLGVGSP